jgi:hypothetical protein
MPGRDPFATDRLQARIDALACCIDQYLHHVMQHFARLVVERDRLRSGGDPANARQRHD